MIFVALLVLLVAAVAVYGILSHRRYPPRSLGELIGYSLVPEEKIGTSEMILTALGAAACFSVSGVVVWKLNQLGHPYLAAAAWAILLTTMGAIQYRRMGRARGCSKCKAPLRMYRMDHGQSPMAILFLHVCDTCRTYQAQWILNIGSDD